MRKWSVSATAAIAVLFVVSDVAWSQAKKPEKAIEPAAVALGRPVDFEKDVFPILDLKCVACHNLAIAENGLNLEDYKALMKGGKRGKVVVAKDPDKSLLFKLAARGTAPAMPPLPNKVSADAFTPKELGILKQWILEGANPGSGVSTKAITWAPISPSIVSIYATAVTNDGQFAACGRANKITIYNVFTGATVAELTDPELLSIQQNGKPMYTPGSSHRDFVHALAFHPNGELLASAGYREVKLWQREAAKALGTVSGLGAASGALAISPDEKQIAIAAGDNSVKLVNAADGKASGALTGHKGLVRGIAYTADGSKIVTASADKSLKIWSAKDGKELRSVEAPAELLSLAILPDGSKAFAGSADKNVYAFDIPAEGDIPAPKAWTGSTGPVSVLAWMPGNTSLLSGGEDGTVRVWDIAKGTSSRPMAHGSPITGIVATAEKVYSSAKNGSVQVWNAANGQKAIELKGDPRSIRQVAALTAEEAEAKEIASNAAKAVPTAEKTVKDKEDAIKKAKDAAEKADKDDKEAEAKFKAAKEKADAAQKALDDKKDDKALEKALADAQKALKDVDDAFKKSTGDKKRAADGVTQAEKSLKEAQEAVVKAKATVDATAARQKSVEEAVASAKKLATEREKAITALAISPDGKEIYAASETGAVTTWDAATGAPMGTHEAHSKSVVGLMALSGPRLITVSADETSKTWNIARNWSLAGVLGPKDGKATADMADSAFANRVISLAFSDDGKMLAAGGGEPSRSGEILIFDVAKKSLLKQLKEPHSDTVCGLEFSRDGKKILSGAADKFVKIFDVETGAFVRSFEGHTNHVLDVSWKSDTTVIASVGADNVIKVWNVETGEQQRTIQGYTKQVTSVQFVGRSGNFAACSGDKSVKLHQASNGNAVRTFAGTGDFMYAVSVSDNEQVVVSGGQDGVLRAWNAANGNSLRTFDPPKPVSKETASTK